MKLKNVGENKQIKICNDVETGVIFNLNWSEIKKKTFVNFFVQCYNYYKWYKTSIALGEKFVLNIWWMIPQMTVLI